MLSMSKLRERQKFMLWTLLFFFVASMTVGGLVGGANIISVIRGAFGGVDTSLYVGRIGDENISISYYLNERQKQINRFRQQGRTIDSRAIQNAGDFAWNAIIERKIKDEKIDELNLLVQDDEIYNFLLNTPPEAFKSNLMNLNLYKDSENNFDLDAYQNAVRTGNLPDTSSQVLFAWEQYLRTFLADRKLQNLYNKLASVSPYEVKEDYINNNLNCTVDILSINTNSINDSLINITQEDIKNIFEEEKDEKHKIDESVTLEYVLFENIDPTDLDSTDIVDLQDSLLQLAIDFSSDASIMTFNEALKEYELSITDTIDVTESFSNNSGIPFQMGFLRQAVRFAFDNSVGNSSEAFTSDNGIAVFNILEKKSASYKNISDVEQSIKRSLSKDKKIEYSINYLKNIDLSKNWNTLSENPLIDLNEDVTSTIGGNFQVIGRSSELAGAVKEMNIGNISDVIESSNQIFVFKLKEKDTFNNELYLDISDSLSAKLLQRERALVYNSWLNNEKNNITIKDMRSKIF